MPNWEYKIITSGSLGFASPQLLEQHLNQLGKEEWEIIHFQTRPDNPLAFHGLARRPVMRDWAVEAAAGAAAPGLRSGAVPAPPPERTAEALSPDELRAEAEERRESLLAREETLRPLHREDEAETAGDEADDWEDDEDLPTFFEAIRPHMRRNQRGPGMAVGVEYLAKKFEQTEADLIEALKECGFTIPTSPKDQPTYLEYDGDLYWLNLNHRHQLWINTREKPRAAFKAVQATQIQSEATAEPAPSAETAAAKKKHSEEKSEPPKPHEPAATEPLPAGPMLLDRLRPMMRRNRRGAGLSGSVSYLARALKTDPKALESAFGSLGLTLPANTNEKPVFVVIGSFVYWLNQDKSGQIWINTREKREGESVKSEQPPPPSPAPQPELPLEGAIPIPAGTAVSSAALSPLAAVRLLLKPTKRGGLAAEVGRLAEELQRTSEELLTALVQAGLKVPEKAREKPVFTEQGGEIFWLNRNAKGELWVNAKPSRFPTGDEAEKASPALTAGETPRRPRRTTRKKTQP